MRRLRQSTSVDVPIGPFLSSADGFTASTALTITQPDIRLKKNAAAWAQKAAAQTVAHEENGFYEVTLDATDTNTLGLLRLAVFKASALPIWEDFEIVTQNVWDTLFSTDVFDTSVTQWLGTAVSAGTAGTPNVDITRIANAAVATGTAQLGVNVVNAAGTAWNSGAITKTSFAAGWNAAVNGTAQSGTTSTLVDTNRTEADTDYWKDALIVFTSGNIAGISRLIFSFNAATHTINFIPALPQAVGTNTYEIWRWGRVIIGGIGGASITSAAFASDGLTAIGGAVTGTLGTAPTVVPSETASLIAKIDWLCAWFRNKQTMNRTTGVINLRNDADSATIGTFTSSDDGTTFTRPKVT